MKATIEFIFFLTFFITGLMTVLSLLSYRRSKTLHHRHLTELWGSFTFMTLANFIFRDESKQLVSLAMIGWIWPIPAIRNFLSDVTGQELMNRVQYVILAVGGFATVALASYGHPFMIYSMPFSVAMGGVGLWYLASAFRKSPATERSFLLNCTYGFLAIFFLLRLSYPFWRSDVLLTEYGFIANVLNLIALAALTLSLQLESNKEKHEKEMSGLLNERTEQLLGQSKYSELGMMSAGIAHEINNPLAIIQAKVTQLLRIYKNQERQQELADGLQQILYTSERINKTIQGVREFVHQDDSHVDEEIKLKDLVSDVLAFCGQRMKNHGVNLRFYGLENFSIRGHKIQLEQVILNLLNNSFDAIEFLPDKWIEMSVKDTPTSVQIYFKDSGPGIPPEVASHMMDPFFTTKAVGKGTGLGLALARGIVEKHHGRLEYLSNAPHTTFLMELPKDGQMDYLRQDRQDPEVRVMHH